MIDRSGLASITDIILKIRDYIDRPYVVVDAEGTIVSVNLAFCGRFRKLRETLEGKSLEELEDWPLDRSATARLIADVVGLAGHQRERDIPLRPTGRGHHKSDGFLKVTGIELVNGLVALFLYPDQAQTEQTRIAAADNIGELRDALSVAAALAAIGHDEAQSVESFQSQFFSRIDVLVTVLELLQQCNDGSTSLGLDQIVEATFEAAFKGGAEVTTSGPNVALGFKNMLVWALILNDIAALYRSSDGEAAGVHSVSWSVADGSFGRKTFHFVWSGPLPENVAPLRIRRSALPARLVEVAFGGTLRLVGQERRLECLIQLPPAQGGDT